jgi:virginiamycin B lyase
MSFAGTVDPYTISPGPDGLWWASGDANNINVITGDWPADTENHISVNTSNAEPFAVAAAPNGTEWFTEFGANKLGEVTSATSRSALEFGVIGMPDGACTGPDGNVYIAAFSTDHVDAFNMSRSPVGGYGFSSAPRGCVAAPDGTVWVAEPETAKVGRIVPGGAVTEYSIPGGAGSEQMTVGPDGNVWFTDPAKGAIGRITITTTPPTITEFPVGASPEGITSGAQNDLWVALNGANAIVRVSAKGTVIKTYPLGAGTLGVYGIARGPDQAIWVTEKAAGGLIRFNIAKE